MARSGVAVATLVAFTLLLNLVPEGGASPLAMAAAGPAPTDTQRLDLAPLGASGAMLLAVSGTHGVQFFEVAAELGSPATPLASFEIPSEFSQESLSAPRLAVQSPSQAALASMSGGRAALTAVDPFLGEVRWHLELSPSPERVEQVSVVAFGSGLAFAYLESSSSGRFVVVVLLTASGAETGRTALAASDALAAGIVAAQPTPYLALQRAASVAVFAVGDGPTLASAGTLARAASSAALWVREGNLGALLSTSTGLVRVDAPLSNLAAAQFASISGGASAPWVAAVGSADGRLLAAVGEPGGAIVLREDAIGQYARDTVGDLSRAAVGADAYGLARLAATRGTSSSAGLVTATAGDPDALSVSLEGPSTIRPAETVTLTATIGAVRSPVTVAGMEVSLPSGWSFDVSPSSFGIAKGDVAQAAIRVLAPAGTPPGDYTVSVAPAAAETTVRFVATHLLHVAAGASIDASVSGAVDLSPGERTLVQVAVVNRGAVPTTVDVVAQAPPGFVVTPWSTAVTLPAGGSATVSLGVSVAAGTPPTAGDWFTVSIRTPDGAMPAKIDLPAFIRAEFSPSLVVKRADVSAAPSAAFDLPIEIVNSGNVGGYVFVRAAIEGLPGSALVSPEGLVWVPPFSKGPAPVTLNVPGNAWAGTSFEVTVGLDDAATQTPLTPSASVGGTVTPVAGIRASYLAGPAVRPGEEATGTLVLENMGNTKVVADLTLGPFPSGFALRAVDAQVGGLVLSPFSTLSVSLVYRAPLSAFPGTLDLPITVASTAGAPLAVGAPVTVVSTHGLALRPFTGPLTVLDPGRVSVVVEFEVTNLGNSADTLTFGWTRAPTALFTLDAFGRATPIDVLAQPALPGFSSLSLRAVVPLLPASGAESDPLGLTVESASGASLSTTFEVALPRSDPQVLSVRVELAGSGGRVGALHQVVANIINNGPATAGALVATLSVDGAIAGSPVPVTSLASGRSRTLTFDFVPRSAETQLTVTLVPANPVTDRDASNNAVTVSYEAVVEPVSPTVPPQAVPAAGISITLIALIALALTEIGKTSLISTLFLPLFVKLNPTEVLDQYLRGQIHGYIIANPGEHYNAIKDQLGVTNGALAYHLRVLEKAGLIRAQRDGMYKRFYPVGVKIPKRRRLSTFQEAIVKTVRDNPAVSQKRIAELLGVSNQVVNYHVKQLEDSGVLKIDRTERASKLFLGPEAPPAENPPASPGPLPSPEV